MRTLFNAIVCLLLPLVVDAAPRIMVSGDPCGLSCHATADPNGVITLYVLVLRTDVDDAGIQAAQYRVTGLPSDWLGGVESVVAGAQSIGDPFNAGALVTFDGCVPWNEYGIVLLHTLRIIAAVPHADQLLSVVGAVPPIDAVHALPVVFRCGGSDPATYESAASEIQLNPGGSICHVDEPFPPPTCDLVSVESATWALVKALYD